MTMGFYKGLGNGLFKDPVTFPTSTNVNNLLSGDFNRDRNLDVIIATPENKILIMPGNGNGVFIVSSVVTLSGSVGNFCKGDFNHDNNLDIAVITKGSSSTSITILSGTGSGSFVQTTVPFATFNNSYIESADFDLDGNSDLVVYTNSIEILKGKGNNTFTQYKSYPAKPGRFRIDDLNNDAFPDIIVANSNYLNLLIGKGDASFSQSSVYIGAPSDVLTSDLNQDGWKDLLTINSSGDNIGVVANKSMGVLSLEPTVNASDFSFENISSLAVTFNFTPGNGEGRIVVVKKGNPILDYPVDGFEYKADPKFGQGDLFSAGTYVVYNGTSNSVTVSGLDPTSVYYFQVYEYNGSGASINYALASTPSQPVTTSAEVTAIESNGIFSSIAVYPNPTDGTVFINTGALNLTDATITLQNNLGEIVLSKTIKDSAKPQNISLQGLNSGVYLMMIKSNEITRTEKIIVR